jgi:integrase
MTKPRPKRGFATIVQEKSGRYSVRYTLASGKRTSAGRTFTNKADAEAWAVDKRRQLDKNPTDKPPEKITFAAYATTWLADRHVAGRPIKPRTRAHYAAILEAHLLPEFGSARLNAITAADVRGWHASTLVDKPTLRSHAYSLLSSIMGSAVRDELIAANPCRIVGAGRTTRVHKIRPATVDEITALAAAMPERLQLMVLLASWCALRYGETIELRRADIDLGAEVIRIRRAAVRVGGTFEVSTPKSDAGVRDVAIPPHLIPTIEDHLAKYVGRKRDSLLFPAGEGRDNINIIAHRGESIRGGEGRDNINIIGANPARERHLQPSTLMRHWYKARTAAGRPDLRFHDLRHSGAVLAAATGASLAELMARLGHSTPTAAMRYQHAAAGRDREIAALLSKLADE